MKKPSPQAQLRARRKARATRPTISSLRALLQSREEDLALVRGAARQDRDELWRRIGRLQNLIASMRPFLPVSMGGLEP